MFGSDSDSNSGSGLSGSSFGGESNTSSDCSSSSLGSNLGGYGSSNRATRF